MLNSGNRGNEAAHRGGAQSAAQAGRAVAARRPDAGAGGGSHRPEHAHDHFRRESLQARRLGRRHRQPAPRPAGARHRVARQPAGAGAAAGHAGQSRAMERQRHPGLGGAARPGPQPLRRPAVVPPHRTVRPRTRAARRTARHLRLRPVLAGRHAAAAAAGGAGHAAGVPRGGGHPRPGALAPVPQQRHPRGRARDPVRTTAPRRPRQAAPGDARARAPCASCPKCRAWLEQHAGRVSLEDSTGRARQQAALPSHRIRPRGNALQRTQR